MSACNPFSIKTPQTWQQIQTLLEIHSTGGTDYDVEMRRRAVRALMSWAKPELDDDEPWNQAPAGDAEPEAVPDDVKQELLRAYAEKPVSRFWQIDGWANIKDGQMPTEPDSEGDWITGGEVVDLMRSRPNVRLMISLDEPPTRETVFRILRKIISEFDGLTYGMPIPKAAPAGAESPLPVDSFDEWVTQAAIAVGRVAQALHDCQISGCTDTARDAMRDALPTIEHLAAEFRRLVERAERNQTRDEQ